MTTELEAAPGSALEKMLSESGTGLDDLDTGGVTPRIKILHNKGLYAENLSGIEVANFDGVVLGMLRQRVLWPTEMSDDKDAKPLCKSLDGMVARPNVEDFPLEASGLELELADGCEAQCGDCKLKDWDSHPTRQGTWCTEQYVLLVMADLDSSGSYMPSVLTFQRSGIKPTRQYLGTFKRKGDPAFAVFTQFGLDEERRGSVDYCVPTFKRGDATPRDEWEVYAENFLTMKAFLQTWRSDDEGDDDDGPAKAVPRDDEELPEF